MFENLSERLQRTIKTLNGQGKLSESNVKEAMRDVRMALLEADVALPVVKDVVAEIKEKALGAKVGTALSPDQVFIKIVSDELTNIMGEKNEDLALNAQPPAVILMAGLQGSGKTTSTAKLARFLKQKLKKKVAVVSCDTYRPAAIQQLETVAGQVDATFLPSSGDENPVDIATRALETAKVQAFDVLIVDTAGRLHIDEEMMTEVQAIHQAVNPVETLFVVDSMTGQDAANTAKAFDEALPLTGVILTKTDGDARGGAALSIRRITGKPIKFLGVGEKTDALEPFHPNRVASRILGMGDVVSLVEEMQEKVDHKKAEKFAKKMQSGKKFTLQDFREQLDQMASFDMEKLMDKIPGMSKIPQSVKDQHMNSKKMTHMMAINDSMTLEERLNPEIIKSSRKRRIAKGCGLDVPEINRLLKQFKEIQTQMGRMNKGKMGKKMMKMAQRGGMGGLPPGMGGGKNPFGM